MNQLPHSPAPQQPGISRTRTWIATHPFVAAGMAFVVGALIAGAVGLATTSAKSEEVTDLQADLDEQAAALEEAEADRDEAEQVASNLISRKGQILDSAREKADGIVKGAQAELAKTKDELSTTQSELSSAEAKLGDVEASLAEAQETQQLSSFGNGIWQSGTDFLPGTYRAPGGSTCYWAKLNSGDTSDIASNSIGAGQQVATIDSAFFETDGCGTWKRVGE